MQTNKNLIRSCEVKGVKVKNMKDKNLGEIVEIMINKTQGKIDCVVISF
ncbi:MAG: PRC-barrel domain-containing protein [Alphaproteobacteria bacterium]|nr:PRC-barrel domain-containing protein [Alphaproteobacteria bacterium]